MNILEKPLRYTVSPKNTDQKIRDKKNEVHGPLKRVKKKDTS